MSWELTSELFVLERYFKEIEIARLLSVRITVSVQQAIKDH